MMGESHQIEWRAIEHFHFQKKKFKIFISTWILKLKEIIKSATWQNLERLAPIGTASFA